MIRQPNLDRRKINQINLTFNKLIRRIGRNSLKFYKMNYNKGGHRKQHFEKWKALKESTIKSKKRRGTFRRGTLKDSGDLYRSLRIQKYGNMKVHIGTSVDYGYYHQTGTDKMEKREYLYHSDALNKENLKIINDMVKPLFKIRR